MHSVRHDFGSCWICRASHDMCMHPKTCMALVQAQGLCGREHMFVLTGNQKCFLMVREQAQRESTRRALWTTTCAWCAPAPRRNARRSSCAPRAWASSQVPLLHLAYCCFPHAYASLRATTRAPITLMVLVSVPRTVHETWQTRQQPDCFQRVSLYKWLATGCTTPLV